MTKKKLLGIILLSGVILSGCGITDKTEGIPTKKTVTETKNSIHTFIPKEEQYYKDPLPPKFEILNEGYQDGVISYEFHNKQKNEVKYGPLFLLEYFDEEDNWTDTSFTHEMRTENISGEEAYKVIFSVNAGENVQEKQNISKYLSKMKPGAYHTLKYYVDYENDLMYKVKIQFVKEKNGDIGHVYGFMDELPLEGYPISQLIPAPAPKPVIPTSDETVSNEEPIEP